MDNLIIWGGVIVAVILAIKYFQNQQDDDGGGSRRWRGYDYKKKDFFMTRADDTLLRVKTGDPDGDFVYTLLIDKAFSNISTMLGQNFRREPQNDTITVYPGFIGSYPNFYFSVEKEQLGEFVDSIRFARTEIDIDHSTVNLVYAGPILKSGKMPIGLTSNIKNTEA